MTILSKTTDITAAAILSCHLGKAASGSKTSDKKMSGKFGAVQRAARASRQNTPREVANWV